ncbi:exonuclease, RNase T and DNA polymerase III [Luminiphilus syltensis NOR5-1B]|uniref:Exonuclease, RNase T and DNA polymerase III n=1 Tax=Luminiphilus syltensis NOR5-1B TaxID=565045 RepID=B8KS22_9GAMM|nr:3'-5' exonuclease [Luminiphilus syltensis]EED34086.1 exonuclease, RNase T and DNA polymerase III [Luminiphilus syltensis NOR5-1B]
MWRLQARRWLQTRRTPPAPELAALWAGPLPKPGTAVEDLKFLVCDAEMSALEVAEGELLSLGWVVIEAGEIVLASAQHHLIRNERSVGQSAVIHQLRDCELSAAGDTETALRALITAAREAVWVFHHASLDVAFLDRACQQVFGAPLLVPVVDTLLLEHRLLERRQQTIGPGDLRLQACRDRYHLPPHDAHNALVDAMATAELLLGHVGRRGRGLVLRDLL